MLRLSSNRVLRGLHHSCVNALRDSVVVITLLIALALSLQACASNAGGHTGALVGNLSAGSGDAPFGGTLAASPLAIESLPGWNDDDLAGVEVALERQCELLAQPGPWPRLCVEFKAQRGAALKAWIASRFQAWPVLGADNNDTGLITGYHEPILSGSRIRENGGQAAVYKRPDDLLRIEIPNALDPAAGAPSSRMRGRLVQDRVLPYYSRADIETRGVLKGQELLWLDDPVEAFFLHVQGSGRVRLRDGSTIRVAFSDTNGLPYRPIGRVMRDRGLLPVGGINAPAIKQWLRANPQSADEIMHTNARYVFFREQPEGVVDAGPAGSLTVPLTPMRSIASDPRVLPPGSLVFLQTTHPATQLPLQRLTISQDTGVAIVGPVRADLFWGNGSDAERNAGLMQSRGRLWLLWPVDQETPPHRK